MTRSPTRLCVTMEPAPMAQSRPMRTSAPITALAPTSVPLPISARGPITAPGSMVTSASHRAVLSICAPSTEPAGASDDGRKAPGNMARATATKARYGAATMSGTVPAGSPAASAFVVRQAPARLTRAASAKVRLSRNPRSAGDARSSAAMPLIRREANAVDGASAPACSAISASVRPRDCRRKTGSLIAHQRPCRQPRSGSEPGAAAEPEDLRLVEHLIAADPGLAVLGDRIGEVEAQWSERRIPEQADARGGADIAELVEADLHGLTRHVPRRRSLVAPQRSGIDEGGELDADLFRQKVERRLRFEARAPVHRAAERVVERAVGQVARTDAARREAAHEVRAHLEMIQHAQVLTAPAGNMAAGHLQDADHVREDFVVVADFTLRAEEVHIAADAREVLLQLGIEAVGRVLDVVERVIGQRVADHRHRDRTVGELHAHRQRGFAVAVAAVTRNDGLGRRELTVVVLIDQRDFLPIDRVARRERQLFGQAEAETKVRTDSLGAVGQIIVGEVLAPVEVDATRHAIAEQIRLDEVQFDAARILA